MQSLATLLVAALPLLNMALAAPTAEPVPGVLEVRQGSHPRNCAPGKDYRVVAGDYCWLIATSHGMTLEQFLNKNPGLICDNLPIGALVCL
ncbi:hypothetical protein B0T25DRAFT_530446 [Lasiosphaeria hispida]|uniref:LysM domain-containing protein n=1 Tax=Lasiosphaeria hispida TaxID=260671 RepID=A0AAJ0ML83_9PEZI|nr:hypothetical protein B0T25DRAFT_530446 [Lasiosphaeria hispida]